MKNIKFRAFIKDSHEMASLPTSEIYKVTEIDFKDKYVTVEDNNKMIDVVGFEDCELLQFTGLTDKNGLKIYEGDILKNHGTVAVVKFERGMFCLTPYVSLYDFAGTEKEVIGNIHTTPKLLTH